jgi:hypothetical protein
MDTSTPNGHLNAKWTPQHKIDTSTQNRHLNAKWTPQRKRRAAMPSKSALKYRQEEAGIQRALRTIEGDPDSNISQLSRDGGLSYGRLLSRHQGRPSRSDRSPAGKKLTKGQEEELLHEIGKLERSIIFRRRTIRRGPIIELANRILQRDHTEEGSPPTVGTQWCGRFIERHPEQFKSETNDQLLRARY